MKSKIAVFLYIFVCLYIYFNREQYRHNYIESDPSGYYEYLPAIFIYNDLAHFEYYKGINQNYRANDADRYGIFDNPNGKRTDKYAIGTCLFELPFFLIARLYCQFDKKVGDDGHSEPYQISLVMSCLFWTFIGLWILRKFLLRHFNDNVTTVTLLCISFGTNLYCYTIFNPGFSHPYSFLIIASILYYTDLWYATLKGKYIYLLSIFLGLAIITRPINISVVLVSVFWMVDSFGALKERMKLLVANRGKLAIGLLLFLAVSMIQMGYWKYTADSWIYYSYIGERFDFSNPQIWNGLFSWRKGWFIYTPMALVGVYGFISLWKMDRKMFWAPLVFLVVMVYIVFSWLTWWYGGGFSARPLIDALPVLAIPLAAFITHTFSQSNKLLKVQRLALITFFIVLNLFQTYQYSFNTLLCDNMTAEYYWRIIGKPKI